MSSENQSTNSGVDASDDSKSVSKEPVTKSTESNNDSPKRKHGVLKAFGIAFGILALIIVFVAGWLGFVPGLSNVMGARTAKDLGVKWTKADFATYEQKTGTTFLDFANAPANPDKPGKKTIFADPRTVEQLGLSQSEITAAINSLNWAWLPATNVQVRLTPGAVEVSGNLKLDHAVDFVNFIGGVGYSSSDVQKAVGWGKRFASGAAFYAKGAASVTDNNLSLTLEQIKIGRFSVPMSTASKAVFTGGSNGLHNTRYLDVKSAVPEQGKLIFTGTYPTTIYVKH